jgi:hypothetical protein
MENWTRPTDEEILQAHADAWARRALACPDGRCRRAGRCRRGVMACPALAADPIPPEHQANMMAVLYRMLQQRAAEIAGGPEAKAAGAARMMRDCARQEALAFSGHGRGRGQRTQGRVVRTSDPRVGLFKRAAPSVFHDLR